MAGRVLPSAPAPGSPNLLFNSQHFLLFFPVVVALYFALPKERRWILLLAASYYFYMCWKAEYVVLIVASTLVDWYVGLAMERSGDRRGRKRLLWLSLLVNLGLLFAFKYYNFANDSLRAVFDSLNVFYDVPEFRVLLPVGISFYTFQKLAYTIDVYRGRIGAEHHLGKFALYVAFFPQLVAGPIERASTLLPQFHRHYDFDYDRVSRGIQQMVWGFFKKVAVADRLAIYVDAVYSDPGSHSGLTLVLATYFFAFQIYCDFSGYSDIAIGAARIMGFDLMENFKRPYLSRTVSEFWSRWHISLSTWFRDYVYIPLGGNRVAVPRWYANLLIVFVVSGMWHGANWTFLAWGALHGGYLVFSIVTRKPRDASLEALRLPHDSRRRQFFDILLTFHLALVAWVFFRADSLGDAVQVFQLGFGGLGEHLAALAAGDIRTVYQAVVFAVGVPKWDLGLALLGLVMVFALDWWAERRDQTVPAPTNRLLRFIWFDFLVLYTLLLGAHGQQQFIYFQF